MKFGRPFTSSYTNPRYSARRPTMNAKRPKASKLTDTRVPNPANGTPSSTQQTARMTVVKNDKADNAIPVTVMNFRGT
jgi:hypothetical protein